MKTPPDPREKVCFTAVIERTGVEVELVESNSYLKFKIQDEHGPPQVFYLMVGSSKRLAEAINLLTQEITPAPQEKG